MQTNYKQGGIFIDLTGRILKSRYCIVKQIGKGGEGTLYLARDLETGIDRAVKKLSLSKKREVKLLRLLDHPFMPGMIDYVEQEEYCYLVMEYIRGKTLTEYEKEGRQFTPEEIIVIGRKVLRIFSYLHSRKPAVYYGDLKPDNLMMTEEGELYLVDFGSAVFSYKRQHHMCTGTKGYAAPEQYQGNISVASDLYALGKTLEHLCGNKRLHYYVRYPGLGPFIRKCCRAREQKRWQSAAEAEKALERIRPLPFKLWNYLIPAAGLLLLLSGVTGKIFQSENELPSFQTALSPVTAWYYSLSYRSGGTELKKEISLSVERSFLRLMKQYTDTEKQKRLLLLLAENSELQGEAAKAEAYYRQLQTTAETEGTKAYGMFLLRHGRIRESRRLYEIFAGETGSDLHEHNLQIWKKKLESGTDDNDTGRT